MKLRRAAHTRAGSWYSADGCWQFGRCISDTGKRSWQVFTAWEHPGGLDRQTLLEQTRLAGIRFASRREAVAALVTALHAARTTE